MRKRMDRFIKPNGDQCNVSLRELSVTFEN